MPTLFLAYLAYLTMALPGSTLGLVWPSMQLSFHQPVGALGIPLAFGVTASVASSAATGRLLPRIRMGPLLAFGATLSALALAAEALAPSLWVITAGFVLFGLGFGATDSALNVHAASHFGAREINWMHASYGLGATIGPLLVTALLTEGLSWRWSYGAIALALVALAVVFSLAHRRWDAPPRSLAPLRPVPAQVSSEPSGRPVHHRRRAGVVLIALTFAGVETGIESGAGIWGYTFLTAGRGLPHETAGLAVSAYWAMMFLGRAVLGPVAERVGPARILGGAVGGVAIGAALMTVPGPGLLAVIGMMTLGVAAAPVFPLFTLTTAQRVDVRDVTAPSRTVSLQVAASAIGSAALPAGIGLVLAAFGARALGPSLLALGLAMCGVHGLLSRLAGRTARLTGW